MWIKASKLFYVLLVMYYGWFQYVFFQVPNMLLILGSCMIGFVFLHKLQTRANIIKSLTGELKIWILFAFTSFIFGLMVAVNKGYLIDSIATFCEFLLLMFGIVYISNQDRNVDFFINVFIVFALVCAITTVFWGIDVGQGRISLGLADNPNLLGFTMVVGVCCVLYKLDFNNLIYSIAYFSAVVLLIYGCFLTGSRKSFICIVIIISYWFAFVALKDIKALRFSKQVKRVVTILFVIGAAYYILVPYFNDSILFTRLTLLSDAGNENRLDMYIESFELFKQSPVFGIGLNNFRAVSTHQTYSHSTYAEALACTGLLGCILYFSPYILLLMNYGKLVNSKVNDVILKQAKIMIILYFVLLFLGVVLIHFYTMTSSIAIGMIIAFYKVNIKSNKIKHLKPVYRDKNKILR